MARLHRRAVLLSVILVGAGGHAKVVVEILELRGTPPVAYADPKKPVWLDLPCEEDVLDWLCRNTGGTIAMGIGGTTPEELSNRLKIIESLYHKGFRFEAVYHPSAHISCDARVGSGVTCMVNSVVQPGATLGTGTIINTGAIVEHDSEIGAGSHVAPGAIVLGQARVGNCCMIGAGSIVLPRSTIPSGTLVAAQTRYPR